MERSSAVALLAFVQGSISQTSSPPPLWPRPRPRSIRKRREREQAHVSPLSRYIGRDKRKYGPYIRLPVAYLFRNVCAEWVCKEGSSYDRRGSREWIEEERIEGDAVEEERSNGETKGGFGGGGGEK